MGNNSSQSSNIATRKKLIPVRVGAVTDWGGQTLSKRIFDKLEAGDVVRVQVEATQEGVAMAKKRDEEEAAKQKTDGGGDAVKPKYYYAICGYGGVVAPYFEITKIKDGTFWGKAMNSYSTLDDFGVLQEGDSFTFRKENIIEIPLRDFFGYSKSRLKKLEQYIQPDKKSRVVTGVEM